MATELILWSLVAGPGIQPFGENRITWKKDGLELRHHLATEIELRSA